MTRDEIEASLRARFAELDAGYDRFEARVAGQKLLVLLHEESDRMRLMVPVAVVDVEDAVAFRRLLEANFAAALDCRYAIYEGVLWAVFVAPLSTLCEAMLDQALGQVIELARSTGAEYSATPTSLGAGSSRLH